MTGRGGAMWGIEALGFRSPLGVRIKAWIFISVKIKKNVIIRYRDSRPKKLHRRSSPFGQQVELNKLMTEMLCPELGEVSLSKIILQALFQGSQSNGPCPDYCCQVTAQARDLLKLISKS